MTERPSILAAGPLTFDEAEALMSTVPPPAAPEGGPHLYDPRTRTVLRHPAQKLAVQAFARELAAAAPEPEPEVERCSCDEALALRAELEEQTAKVAELEEVLRTEARVRLRLMNEQDGLRERLDALRRAHDTDAVTCREALDRVDELERERDQLRAEAEQLRGGLCFTQDALLSSQAMVIRLKDLLREVQYEQSSAIIELSPTLERRIEDLIGRHPRGAEAEPGPAPAHRMTGAERDTDSERGSKIPGYSEEYREDGSLSPVARYPLAVLDEPPCGAAFDGMGEEVSDG